MTVKPEAWARLRYFRSAIRDPTHNTQGQIFRQILTADASLTQEEASLRRRSECRTGKHCVCAELFFDSQELIIFSEALRAAGSTCGREGQASAHKETRRFCSRVGLITCLDLARLEANRKVGNE